MLIDVKFIISACVQLFTLRRWINVSWKVMLLCDFEMGHCFSFAMCFLFEHVHVRPS